MNSTSSIPTLVAASLIAVPAHYSKTNMKGAIAIAEGQCANMLNNEALLSHVWRTDYGNLGAIFIPVVDFNLFRDKKHSLEAAVKGVELAATLGARCVSFTGMIPAATDYAKGIETAIQEKSISNPLLENIRLTTGHAAVVAAFAFNVERLLISNDRAYEQEKVAFVGLGSIGKGILELMANKPHPKHIYLVDVKKKEKEVKGLKVMLENKYGLRNKITILLVEKNESVPDELYSNTTLFLSASSASNIIDIKKFESNTLLVDDSFPLGFDAQDAIDRIEDKGDIKITIAGGFQGPSSFDLLYKKTYPDNPVDDELLSGFEKVANAWNDCMTGCIYSSLLTPYFNLPDTIGPVTYDHALQFYNTLSKNNFIGTPPYFITVGCDNESAIFPM